MQDNYHTVIDQMEAFGIKWRKKDLPLQTDLTKRRTCGISGKWWYRLYEFRPRNSSKTFVVGSFGSYKTGDWQKVDMDWKGLSDDVRAELAEQKAKADAAADQQRQEVAQLAALSATQIWERGRRDGHSPYLDARGLSGMSCRYLAEDCWLITGNKDDDLDVFDYSDAGLPKRPGDRRMLLPAGTLLLPLIRYDLPRAQALQAVQHITPDGRKIFSKGFSKPGCALRLGDIDEDNWLLLVCEGYATGLSIRMALDDRYPVFVALDAGNLQPVVELLRGRHPDSHILICADDDWLTKDQLTGEKTNPGKTKAKAITRQVDNTSFIWPVFLRETRQARDTDFDDLRQRQGLDAARLQIGGVVRVMERRNGR